MMSPFRYQTSANVARRQENDLSFKIGITMQPLLVSQKFMEHVVSKKCSRQSLINNSWLIRHMICSMRIMLALLLDILTNTLSKKTRLANTFWRPMGAYAIWMKTNFESYANVEQSLNPLWTRSCWSINAIHALTQETISFFENFFFKNTFNTFAPFFSK